MSLHNTRQLCSGNDQAYRPRVSLGSTEPVPEKLPKEGVRNKFLSAISLPQFVPGLAITDYIKKETQIQLRTVYNNI